MTTLSTNDIKDYIPHRYENLLIDSFNLTDSSPSEFQITLSKNDALNRHIFLKNSSNPTIPIPVIAEFCALGSIVSSGKIPDGAYIYFAAISNVTSTNTSFLADEPCTGLTEKVSDKKGFFKYKFSVSTPSQGFIQGQIMAYYDKTGSASTTALEPLDLPQDIIAALPNKSKVQSLTYKYSTMTFCDFIHDCAITNSALFSYHYASDHLLTKGHFPNNPVMMGVCQWMMVEDSVASLLQSNNHHLKESTLSLNAILFKEDLTPVCEIKSIELECTVQSHSNEWLVNTKSVKKILFKQRVMPNDTIFCYLTNITVT